MFDLYDIERLTAWKQFRETLETSETPLEDTALLWSKAPFVSNRLSLNPATWPDAWQLIIDGEFDSLGLALGILHTLQLTQRFKADQFEIHMYQDKKNKEFILVVNNMVLNWAPRVVIPFADLPNNVAFTKVWTSS